MNALSRPANTTRLGPPRPSWLPPSLMGPATRSHARQVDVTGETLGRRLAFHGLSPAEFRRETADSRSPPVVEMLLAAWDAAVGHPAYVTTTVADFTGAPAAYHRGLTLFEQVYKPLVDEWYHWFSDDEGLRLGQHVER
jgi:hypothetical protein